MFKTAPPPNKKVSKQVSHFFLYSDMYIIQYIVKFTKGKTRKGQHPTHRVYKSL